MPRIATNANGDVQIFNDQSGAWEPARTATNDAGDKVYYDGSAWLPLNTAAPAARESPPGGRRGSAPAASGSPTPAGAPVHDFAAPAIAMAQDANEAARGGFEDMAQGGRRLFGRDPATPDGVFSRLQGAVQMPYGAYEALMAPAAPLMRATNEANQHNIGEPITKATGSEYLGKSAANLFGGIESLAVAPPLRGAPMRSLPYRPQGPIAPGEPPPAAPRSMSAPGTIDLAPHEYGEPAPAQPSAAAPATQGTNIQSVPVQPTPPAIPPSASPAAAGAPPIAPPTTPPVGGAPPAGPTPPGGTPPAPQAPNQPGLVQIVKNAAKTIEKIVSPTTVDASSRAAEGSIREQIGLGRRDTEIARAALDEFNPIVRQMDGPQRRDLIRYIEGRSQGQPLANPAWQPLADTLRTAFEQRERKLAALPSTAQMAFVTDFYPHQWEDPRAAQAFVNNWPMSTKQGTGGFTKKRTIPTVEDGLAAGLVPKTLNPIEAAMHYVANADRFIAINRVFDDARANQTIKYRFPGKQLPDEVELHGRLGNKTGPGGIPMKAYAPDGWARVFNNFIDPGFTGPVGDVVNSALRASNFVTALELSLSGYHAVTMANEASINTMARGVQELVSGHPIKAVKAMGEAAVPGVSAVRAALRGHAVQQVYKGTRQGTPLERQIADLIARAGGQAIKMDRAWLGSRQGSYITAFKRGALKEEFLADKADIKARPIVGTASVATRHIARTMDTAMSWLFEHVVPKMKVGAFYEQMGAWLRRNPQATHDETLQMARTLWDSIDNRFGEMVRDNIFWKNTLKQSSQLGLRSYSWTFGAAREIAGGVWDTGKAPFTGKWTPRMSYTVSLPIVYGIWSAIYQYMKTGQAPQDENDLLAPRTGGIDSTTGKPERIVPPGFMKDVFGWANHGILGELYNKSATLPRTAWELARNQDWRGLPIAPGSHVDDPNAPSWLKSYFDHVLENLGPFGVKQAIQGQPRGSNLGTVETLMGFKPAGQQFVDPQRHDRQMRGIESKAWQRKLRADDREQRRYKGPVD